VPKKAVTKKAPPVKKAPPAKKAAAAKQGASKKKKPKAPPALLTGKQKSHLRALAHPLKAVVHIGHQGLTEGVVAALDAALEQHELIKVKVSSEAELSPADLGPDLERATFSRVAQIIGRTLVLYRRCDHAPKIKLPKPKAAARGGALLGAATTPAQLADDAEEGGDDGLDDDDEDFDEDSADEGEDLE
jgi:RNA-binding protein